MKQVRSAGTTAERRLAKGLRNAGVRYRSQTRIGGIRVDFVLPQARTVVFVDGCFWHGCTKHRGVPKSNARFWAMKFQSNKQRDRRNDRELRRRGWRVIRLWEHTVVRKPRVAVGVVKGHLVRMAS
jgi:DNA mismatch endonuclease Vsr